MEAKMIKKSPRAIYLLSPTPRAEVEHLPMIEFAIVAESIDFSVCDTLMFSSKQAVKSADAIDSSWRDYPCIAIGGATKKQIEMLGGTVTYQPSLFYADVLSQDIARLFSDKKLLYLRPKEVSFDSKGFLLDKGIVLEEQVIYETSCISYGIDDTPKKNAIIIFTSPSSIQCFLKNFSWDVSYTAIVIGDATKVHLPKGADFAVADRPLIDACVAKARELSV